MSDSQINTHISATLNEKMCDLCAELVHVDLK